jgi:uncharacterized membrane protein
MTDRPAVARPERRPVPIAFAAGVLVLLALIQVAVAALFLLYQAELAAWVAGRSPGMTGEALDDRIAAAIIEGIVVHALLFVVYLAAAWSTRTRSPAVRIFITFLAAVATFTDGLILGPMPAVFPNERIIILSALTAATVLRLILALLLWMPLASRAWYARKAA